MVTGPEGTAGNCVRVDIRTRCFSPEDEAGPEQAAQETGWNCWGVPAAAGLRHLPMLQSMA